MTDAAIYVRISDDREGKALGVERQEADCRALVAREGLTVTALYSDNDISASTRSRKTRPAYARMLAAAQAREFSVVVAYTSSRITRRPRELEDLLDLYERHGTRFQYVSSPEYDFGTADGRMGARIAASIDAAEAERIAERVKRKLIERTANGLPHGGPRPFGWEPDRITIRQCATHAGPPQPCCEAGTIRWGVGQTLAGVPIRSQFRRLNELGVTNTRGGAWTHATWLGILTTARHAGLMRDGSPASWGQIITPERHRAVVRYLSDPSRVTTPGKAGRLHLLSGIARCAICRADHLPGLLRVGKSIGRGGPDYLVYRCYPAAHVVRNRDHVEEFVRAVFAKRLRRPDAADLLTPPGHDEAARRRAAAEAEVERLGHLLDEAADEHARLGLSVRQLAAYSAPLQARLAQAESAAEPPPDRAAVLGEVIRAPDPGAAFLALPIDRQRAVVGLLTEITIGRGRRGNVFYPDGIEIDWKTS